MFWEDSCRANTAWSVSISGAKLVVVAILSSLRKLGWIPARYTAMGYEQVIAHRLGLPPEYNNSGSALPRPCIIFWLPSSYCILATVLIHIHIHAPYRLWLACQSPTIDMRRFQMTLHTVCCPSGCLYVTQLLHCELTSNKWYLTICFVFICFSTGSHGHKIVDYMFSNGNHVFQVCSRSSCAHQVSPVQLAKACITNILYAYPSYKYTWIIL